MNLISQSSPIAVHFGALETRLLQLQSRGRGWVVRSAKTFSAQGKNRHWTVSEALKQNVRQVRLRGRDVAVGMSGEEVAVALVPVEESNRNRLNEILQEAATSQVTDEEGVVYRYLPLSSTVTAGRASEEFLLLTVGTSELRRCTDAVKGMGLRPVSLELSAFAIARALGATRNDSEHPWSFLHLGFGHSLFGVMHEGEMCFLKPLQVNGRRLLSTLQRVLDRSEGPEDPAGPDLMQIMSGEAAPQILDVPDGEDVDPELSAAGIGGQYDSSSVAVLNNRAVGHAVEVLHALRLEAEALAQEVRACMRHFSNRSKGAKVESVVLGGFGATLPEVETAVSKALTTPVEMAKPFTELGIRGPEQVMTEEHMWTTALGLAMRGYE